MAFRIRHITVDAADPYQQAEFWSAVSGWPISDDDEPGDDECCVENPHGPGLLFVRVPEPKVAKNRVHLDIGPARRRDEEVERLLVLGATIVGDHRTEGGLGWVTMADPEGNEFCVERSDEERAD